MSIRIIHDLAVEQHDVNAGLQGTWTIEFELDPGETLIGPVTVIAVQPDYTDTPLVETTTPLVISSITIGQVSVTPNVWGISFNTQAGNPQIYWLRGAAQRTDGVSTHGVHRTVRLSAGNN